MSRNKKKQYYVVVKGHNPGIYQEWYGEGGAEEQVNGVPRAIYKGFQTRQDALAWLTQFSKETLAEFAPNLLKLLTPKQLAGMRESAPQPACSVERASFLSNVSLGSEVSLLGDASLRNNTPLPNDVPLDKVVIFTDGGALRNPGRGGYGVVLHYTDHCKELSGGFRRTTSNRMELLACIEGLKALKRPCEVIIYSDSRYVVNGMTKGWAKRWQARAWMRTKEDKAKNVDLWEQLLALCTQHKVKFQWVKGHAGNPDNERCDQLATEAIRGKALLIDENYEQGQTQIPASIGLLSSE